jgi:hypothetical protein
VSGSGTVSSSGSTQLTYLTDLHKAVALSAANRKKQPTHVIVHPRRLAWLSAGVSTSMPLLNQGHLRVTDARGVFESSIEGLTFVASPGLPVNLGASTNEDWSIICRPADMYVSYDETPRDFSFKQISNSGNLDVRVQSLGYSFFSAARRVENVVLLKGYSAVL